MKKNVLHIFAIIILWVIVGYMIMAVEPELVRDVGIEGSYLPFTLCVGGATCYTFAVILGSAKRGLVVSGYLLGQMYLQLMAILTWWVVVASLLLLIFTLWLTYQRNDKVRSENTFNNESGGNV